MTTPLDWGDLQLNPKDSYQVESSLISSIT